MSSSTGVVPTRKVSLAVIVTAILVGGLLGAIGFQAGGDGGRASAQQHQEPNYLQGFSTLDHRLEGERLVSDLPEGRRAILTLDPQLQEHTESVLERYDVPFASLVAVEPATGRVLAYVSHSSANPEPGDLALDPTPPTASVFKIISAAALVDAGVSADAEVCYHGGFSRLRESDLEDTERDNRCATLADAVGGSINTIFAKLSTRNLDTPTLERYAGAFGFGHALPFDVPTRPSPGEVPDNQSDRLEFARTSAGFWHMHMSPLHGALIGATFANHGEMPRATMVEQILDADGTVLQTHEPTVYRRVISRRTAREVSRMMERTVSHGTARRTFHDNQGRPFLPDVRVAGKTGTLSGTDPYRGYTWWVGFAPAEEPQIAVAALVVNTPRWRIKAAYLAREALREYLMR